MGFANTLSPPTRDPRIEILDHLVDVIADRICAAIGRKGVSETSGDLEELMYCSLDLFVGNQGGNHRVGGRIMCMNRDGGGRSSALAGGEVL